MWRRWYKATFKPAFRFQHPNTYWCFYSPFSYSPFSVTYPNYFFDAQLCSWRNTQKRYPQRGRFWKAYFRIINVAQFHYTKRVILGRFARRVQQLKRQEHICLQKNLSTCGNGDSAMCIKEKIRYRWHENSWVCGVYVAWFIMSVV